MGCVGLFGDTGACLFLCDPRASSAVSSAKQKQLWFHLRDCTSLIFRWADRPYGTVLHIHPLLYRCGGSSNCCSTMRHMLQLDLIAGGSLKWNNGLPCRLIFLPIYCLHSAFFDVSRNSTHNSSSCDKRIHNISLYTGPQRRHALFGVTRNSDRMHISCPNTAREERLPLASCSERSNNNDVYQHATTTTTLAVELPWRQPNNVYTHNGCTR